MEKSRPLHYIISGDYISIIHKETGRRLLSHTMNY